MEDKGQNMGSSGPRLFFHRRQTRTDAVSSPHFPPLFSISPISPHCRANSLLWLFIFFFLLLLLHCFQHLLTHFRKTLEAEKINFTSFTGNNLQFVYGAGKDFDRVTFEYVQYEMQTASDASFRIRQTQCQCLNIKQPKCSSFESLSSC